MKRQILILAMAMITIAFVSCTKEKIETQQTNISEEIATARKPGSGGGLPKVSNKGLLGRYEFNGTLKDTTGKLADGDPTIDRVLFTTDRKGQANSAIRFNEAYGVDIFDVPTNTEMTMSVWVKHDMYPTLSWIAIVYSWQSFTLQQFENTFNCSHWNGITAQNVGSGPVDNNWHHVAATRDNTSMKFYMDGVLIGSSPTPAGGGPYYPLNNYSLGYGFGSFWKGSMDDLRLYERVLSATEINTLANQ